MLHQLMIRSSPSLLFPRGRPGLKVVCAASAFLLVLGAPGQAALGQPIETEVVESADSFDSELSPHGTWYDSDQYGRIWVPDRRAVGEDFVPYATRGSWEATEHGWMFVSEYPWGSIPFHYGRWFFDPDLGWAWVPGDEWAPAWVRWREGGDYVGWMPEPPEAYDVPESWVFVTSRDFYRPRMWRYMLPRARFSVALRATSPIRDVVRVRRYRWHRGPDIARIRTVSRRPVRVVSFAPPPERTYVRVHRRGGRPMVVHTRNTIEIRRRNVRFERTGRPGVRRVVHVSGPGGRREVVHTRGGPHGTRRTVVVRDDYGARPGARRRIISERHGHPGVVHTGAVGPRPGTRRVVVERDRDRERAHGRSERMDERRRRRGDDGPESARPERRRQGSSGGAEGRRQRRGRGND